MRINFIALFLLCLTVNGSFLPFPGRRIASGTCTFDNSYTRHLRANKVKLYPRPVLLNAGKCGTEWVTHGTCCPVNGIDEYDVMQRFAAVQLLDRSEAQVSKMSLAVTQYLQGFKSYLANEKLTEKKALYVENGSKNLLQEQKIELSTRMLSILEPIRGWLSHHEMAMIRNQETCVRKLQNVRSSSVCYTCSGRAQTFFTGDSLNVHENTCRDLIKECSNSWWYLINYLDQINRFNKIITDIEAEAGITIKNRVGLTKELLTWADENNLRRNLIMCYNGNCEFSIAKKICENFVSIEKPIYLQRALHTIQGVLSYSDSIKTNILTSSKGFWGQFTNRNDEYDSDYGRNSRYGNSRNNNYNAGRGNHRTTGGNSNHDMYLNRIRAILRERNFDGLSEAAPVAAGLGLVSKQSKGKGKKSRKG